MTQSRVECQTGVIGVFPTERQARAAAAAAQRAGADPAEIRVGDHRDHVTSLQNDGLHTVEVQVLESTVRPFTMEMWNAILPATVIGCVLGAIVALPGAMVHFGGLVLWGRMVIVAIVGAALGSVIGFERGATYSGRRSMPIPSPERGVTVAIDDASPSEVDALRSLQPIRLATTLNA
ncbi:MAG: hypothetical protein JWL83_3116 [Actinomycetia bacterium]|nr:hypothetical protein [Actinomycetes bacterium]